MRILLFTLLSFAAISTNAQTLFTYEYDSNGNRISRDVIYLKAGSGDNGNPAKPDEPGENFSEENRIDAVLGDYTMSLYPNPTLSDVNLEISDPELKVYDLRVYDTQGNILTQMESVSPKTILHFDTFAPGNYFIWLNTSEGIRRYQVIKQ